MKNLTRLYDQLTADERFSAFMAAASRMDTEEMDVLNDTCPRMTYTMDDWDYTRKKVKYFDCWMLMQLRFSKITGAMAALALLAAYGDDEQTEKSMVTARELVTLYRALNVAWQRFSESVGISGEIGMTLLHIDEEEFRDFLLTMLGQAISEEMPPPTEDRIQKEYLNLISAWNGTEIPLVE